MGFLDQMMMNPVLQEAEAVAPESGEVTSRMAQSLNPNNPTLNAMTSAVPGGQPYKPGIWERLTPLITGGAAYGMARMGGADPVTAGAAGTLAGLIKMPGPHQKALTTALSVLGTQNPQPGDVMRKSEPEKSSVPTGKVDPYMARSAPPAASAPSALTPGAGLPYSTPAVAGAGTVPTPGGYQYPYQPPPNLRGARGGAVGHLGGFSKQKGVPNPLKGLHLKNPAGVVPPDPMKKLAKSVKPVTSIPFAEGGKVSEKKKVGAELPKSEEIKRADSPKFPSGMLKDVAVRSNPNVKMNLPPPGLEKKMAKRQNEDQNVQVQGLRAAKKFMHGGQVRGRMSEALGGPAVPKVPGEISPIGGKAMASGGKVGGKYGTGKPVSTRGSVGSAPVRGGGITARGLRPAKKY
jgi:hypothetical protein